MEMLKVLNLVGTICAVAGYVICLIGMYMSRKSKDTDGLIWYLGLLLSFSIFIVH